MNLESLYRKKDDEKDLHYKAMKAFQVDPNQDFRRLKSQIGFEAASVYCQLFFANQTRFKKLRRELDLHPNEFNPRNSNFDVLIVMPPKSLMASRALDRLSRQTSRIAMSIGFSRVSQAILNSDNALEGARRLSQVLQAKKKAGRRVILVSYSFGSAFVRLMLDHCSREELSVVQGWVNGSGLIFGTPRFHCSDRSRFYHRVSRSQRSFSCEQRYFHGALHTKGIRTVHILGTQASFAGSRTQRKVQESLRAWGPNDGVIGFAPYQNIGSPILSLPSQGHLLNLESFSSTFARILSSLVSTLPMEKEGRDLKRRQVTEPRALSL